jgi:hypothetical protein
MAVINGRSWPNTQHFTFTQGETVHWRWIDAAFEGHPLHLHGFYFRVDSRGNGQRDNVYQEDSQRDMVVTERLDPGDTRTISWVPERPGNCSFTATTRFTFAATFLWQHFSQAAFRTTELPTTTAPSNQLTKWAEWCWVSRYVPGAKTTVLLASFQKDTWY